MGGPTASVVGLGVIGGSIALALRRLRWRVAGVDVDERHAAFALQAGIIDFIGIAPESSIVFVATPVDAIPGAVSEALGHTSCPITDTGSLKSEVVRSVGGVSRFVPGHPMAGSERPRLDGADGRLFEGATWVLTPTCATGDDAYKQVRDVIVQLGATVMDLEPQRHDDLVAAVSHVPHLTAASLLNVAMEFAGSDRDALLTLAAGGFRDMTRVASGNPALYADVCLMNRSAIESVLGLLIMALEGTREMLRQRDVHLLQDLVQAQANRDALPCNERRDVRELSVSSGRPEKDAADIPSLAALLGVRLRRISPADGDSVSVIVDSHEVDLLRGGLLARGYTVTQLGNTRKLEVVA